MSMSYVYDSERPMPRLIALGKPFGWMTCRHRGPANVNATMREIDSSYWSKTAPALGWFRFWARRCSEWVAVRFG